MKNYKNFIVVLLLSVFFSFVGVSPISAENRQRPKFEAQVQAFETTAIYTTQVVEKVANFKDYAAKQVIQIYIPSSNANQHFLIVKSLSLIYAMPTNLSVNCKNSKLGKNAFHIFENHPLYYGTNYLSYGYDVAI